MLAHTAFSLAEASPRRWPPGWNAIPSMAWAVPWSVQRPTVASSSSPRTMFARCRDAASSGTLMEERLPQAASL